MIARTIITLLILESLSYTALGAWLLLVKDLGSLSVASILLAVFLSVRIGIERGPIVWTGKLMLLYQLARRIHETYPSSYFYGRIKREAIKLVTEQGLTLAEASRKLDVATKSLRTWMDQQERGKLKSSLGASKLTADQQRIRELERELAIAKMERGL